MPTDVIFFSGTPSIVLKSYSEGARIPVIKGPEILDFIP